MALNQVHSLQIYKDCNDKIVFVKLDEFHQIFSEKLVQDKFILQNLMGCAQSNEAPAPTLKGTKQANTTIKNSSKNEPKSSLKESKNQSSSKPISSSKINTSRSVPKSTVN